MTAAMLTTSLLLGSGIGLLTGFFGAGGGFILTPALHLFLGMSMPIAIGTGSAQIGVTALLTLFQRMDRHWTGVRIASYCAIGIFPGCWLGARIVAALARHGEAAVNLILLAFFAVLLFGIGLGMFMEHDGDVGGGTGWLQRVRIPPVGRFCMVSGGSFSIPVLVVLGVFMGILSGLLGIGGGVVMLPVLIYLVGLEAKYATLVTTMLVFLSSSTSAWFHFLAGSVDSMALIPLLIGAIVGARCGVKLQKRCSASRLKKGFVWVVFVAWLLVVFKLVEGLWS